MANIIHLPTQQTLQTGLEAVKTQLLAWNSTISTLLGRNINHRSLKPALNHTLHAVNRALITKGSTAAADYSEIAGKIDAISTGITPTGTISITQNGIVDVTQYAQADVAVPIPTGTLFETETVTKSFVSAITATFDTSKGKKPFFFQLNRTQALDENAYGMISLSACQRILNRNQYEGGGYAKNSTTGQTIYAPAVSGIPNNYNGYIVVSEQGVTIHCIQNNNNYFAGTYELVCYYLVE